MARGTYWSTASSAAGGATSFRARGKMGVIPSRFREDRLAEVSKPDREGRFDYFLAVVVGAGLLLVARAAGLGPL